MFTVELLLGGTEGHAQMPGGDAMEYEPELVSPMMARRQTVTSGLLLGVYVVCRSQAPGAMCDFFSLLNEWDQEKDGMLLASVRIGVNSLENFKVKCPYAP